MQLIIGNHRITSDTHCFVVEERKVRKSGENAGQTVWANPCYPSTLLQACQTVLEREISKSEACELGQIIACVERAERAIVAAVKEATP